MTDLPGDFVPRLAERVTKRTSGTNENFERNSKSVRALACLSVRVRVSVSYAIDFAPEFWKQPER